MLLDTKNAFLLELLKISDFISHKQKTPDLLKNTTLFDKDLYIFIFFGYKRKKPNLLKNTNLSDKDLCIFIFFNNNKKVFLLIKLKEKGLLLKKSINNKEVLLTTL